MFSCILIAPRTMSNPILEQPTKDDLKVDFDFNHMIKGEWEVGALDVCHDPKTCE